MYLYKQTYEITIINNFFEKGALEFLFLEKGAVVHKRLGTYVLDVKCHPIHICLFK